MAVHRPIGRVASFTKEAATRLMGRNNSMEPPLPRYHQVRFLAKPWCLRNSALTETLWSSLHHMRPHVNDVAVRPAAQEGGLGIPLLGPISEGEAPEAPDLERPSGSQGAQLTLVSSSVQARMTCSCSDLAKRECKIHPINKAGTLAW